MIIYGKMNLILSRCIQISVHTGNIPFLPHQCANYNFFDFICVYIVSAARPLAKNSGGAASPNKVNPFFMYSVLFFLLSKQ